MYADLQPFRKIATNVNNKIDRPVIMRGGKVKDLGIFGRIVKYISQIGNQYKIRIKRNDLVIQHLKKTVAECYGDFNPITQKIHTSLDQLSIDLKNKHQSIYGKDVKKVFIDAGIPIIGAGNSPLEILRNALTEDIFYAHLDRLKKNHNSEFQNNHGLTDVEMVALDFAASIPRDSKLNSLKSYLVDMNVRDRIRSSYEGYKYKGLEAIFDVAVAKLPDARADDYVSYVNQGPPIFTNGNKPFTWREVGPAKQDELYAQEIYYESNCAKLLKLDMGNGPKTFLAFPSDSKKTVQYQESPFFVLPREVHYKIEAKESDQV